MNIFAIIKNHKLHTTIEYLEKLHRKAKTAERKKAIEFIIKQLLPKVPDEFSNKT